MLIVMQKLHDTSGRFLLVTFLEKLKREDGSQRDTVTCLLENGRDCFEIKSSFREIRVDETFEDNFTCFSWFLDFISSTAIQVN